eukprot:5257410-Alexandrium_andersonii.AAC.1
MATCSRRRALAACSFAVPMCRCAVLQHPPTWHSSLKHHAARVPCKKRACVCACARARVYLNVSGRMGEWVSGCV